MAGIVCLDYFWSLQDNQNVRLDPLDPLDSWNPLDPLDPLS